MTLPVPNKQRKEGNVFVAGSERIPLTPVTFLCQDITISLMFQWKNSKEILFCEL